MGKLKVFVGSSGEGEYLARLIAQILADNKIASLGWWETSAFPPGETFVESLHRLVAECNAAIFVATPDDLTVLREEEIWTARGNVLLEYGMFSGVHGRRRVALATADSLTLPSDLKGISVLELEDVPGAPTDKEGRPDVDSRAAFKRSNEGQIVDWADSAKRAPADTGSELFELFPQVADVLVDAIRRVKDDSDPSAIHRDLDLMASDVIGAVAATADASGYLGITESLVEKIQRLLIPTCSAIHAVDVLGPRGWLHPRTYRYLAPQIRRYIESNTDDEGRWRVTVSPTVEAAINLAVDNAKRSGALDESGTAFDNPEYLNWGAGDDPRLEFSRVLLWSQRELLSPVAESVIAIHLAFNVPLFFLDRPLSSPDREVDYILFRVGERVDGFFGLREDGYRTQDIREARIPRVGGPMEAYRALLQDEDLLFAHDARFLALSGKLEAAVRDGS